MTDQQATLVCGYSYDPLDRLVNCAPQNQQAIQRFYRKDRLGTEIQGQIRHSIFEHLDQPLAQQSNQAGKVDTWLLATDFQQSVLHSMSSAAHQSAVFCPYGHRTPESGLSSLLGFNGQRRDPVTGHYLLGNGYRAFNPVLMRFNCPDSLSPFDKGGVNAYAYCAGDPVNRVDPTGHHPGLAPIPRRSALNPLPPQRRTNVNSRNVVGDFFKSLRPGYRIKVANLERLASIEKYNKAFNHVTESPPFTKTKLHASKQKAALEEFVGRGGMEDGLTKEFLQLAENSSLADATLKRVAQDNQALQQAKDEMVGAAARWQKATGFGKQDHARITRETLAIRR